MEEETKGEFIITLQFKSVLHVSEHGTQAIDLCRICPPHITWGNNKRGGCGQLSPGDVEGHPAAGLVAGHDGSIAGVVLLPLLLTYVARLQ